MPCLGPARKAFSRGQQRRVHTRKQGHGCVAKGKQEKKERPGQWTRARKMSLGRQIPRSRGLQQSTGSIPARGSGTALVFFCLESHMLKSRLGGPVFFFCFCFFREHAWGVQFFFFKSRLGGRGVSLFLKSRLGGFGVLFLKSLLRVPLLVLLHSCLWAGAFLLLNSRLWAGVFSFEITPGGRSVFFFTSRLGVISENQTPEPPSVMFFLFKKQTGPPRRDFKICDSKKNMTPRRHFKQRPKQKTAPRCLFLCNHLSLTHLLARFICEKKQKLRIQNGEFQNKHGWCKFKGKNTDSVLRNQPNRVSI